MFSRPLLTLTLTCILLAACGSKDAPRHEDAPELTRVDLPLSWPVPPVYMSDNNGPSPFYLERVPENPKGLIVVLPSGGESVEELAEHMIMDEEAGLAGWATLYPSLNWHHFQPASSVDLLDACIADCLSNHNIPADQVAIGGLSNGGTIALEYGIRAGTLNNTAVQPRMIYILDTMLDYARFYDYTVREIERDFSPAGVGEARYLQGLLTSIHGGSPMEAPAAYDSTSIYTPNLPDGGRCSALMETPLRLFTDLDLNWMFEERQRDLRDWNGSDLIGMANRLKANGHQNLYMHVSQGSGERPDGTPHPHSWSIMWHGEVVGWLDDNYPDVP